MALITRNSSTLPLVQSLDKLDTLDQLIERTERRIELERPEDYVLPIDRFALMFPATPEGMVHGVAKDLSGQGMNMGLTEHAVNQICRFAKIPVEFFRRMPAKMKMEVANHFVQATAKAINENRDQSQKMMTYRTAVDADGCGKRVVRAMLSDKYTALDDIQGLHALRDAVGDRQAFVQYAKFNPLSTHIRVLFPQEVTELRRGDVVMHGLHYSNSEVGTRSYRVDGLAFRLACTNGMVSTSDVSSYILRHVGNAERLHAYARQAIDDALGHTNKLIDAFRTAIGVGVVDPLGSIEALWESNDMAQHQFDAMLAAYNEEPEPTLFGVVNAVTRAAQALDDDARYEMERVGSRLLLRPDERILTAVRKPSDN